MSVSDASALAVAILTGIGLIVALLTFRRSLASRARLDLSVGQELILHYASDSKLILTASFAIINKGSLPGLATELSAVICHPYSTVPFKSLLWRTFEVSEPLRDETDGRTRWWTHSAGPVHTLIVPGRAAGSSGITEKIRLYEEIRPRGDCADGARANPLPPQEAVYPVTFYLREGSSHRTLYKYSCRLSIKDTHAQEMKDKCTEQPTWKERLVFRRRPVTGAESSDQEHGGDLFESTGFRGGY
jgi:hypothetical protein